jgi:hypothetical protein
VCVGRRFDVFLAWPVGGVVVGDTRGCRGDRVRPGTRLYSGNTTTDTKGLATVQLPAWFDKINTDFRYQLTIIGTRGWNARVSQEIKDNQFTIQTDQPNVQVSWQVTAKRNDPYMRAHPFQAEQPKTGEEQGKYVTPQAYGQPASASIIKTPPAPPAP